MSFKEDFPVPKPCRACNKWRVTTEPNCPKCGILAPHPDGQASQLEQELRALDEELARRSLGSKFAGVMMLVTVLFASAILADTFVSRWLSVALLILAFLTPSLFSKLNPNSWENLSASRAKCEAKLYELRVRSRNCIDSRKSAIQERSKELREERRKRTAEYKTFKPEKQEKLAANYRSELERIDHEIDLAAFEVWLCDLEFWEHRRESVTAEILHVSQKTLSLLREILSACFLPSGGSGILISSHSMRATRRRSIRSEA